MIDRYHTQQELSSSREQQQQRYQQETNTASLLNKNNKLFEAHRKYTERIRPTQVANHSSSSMQLEKSNVSKFLSSQSSDTRHQDVTKTVSNSSSSTMDKMYVNPGFHLSYSPNGMMDSSSKSHSRNLDLPSDVEICEVNDDDMNLNRPSDSYERLRKYQITQDNPNGHVSLTGDLPPIRQLNGNRNNSTNCKDTLEKNDFKLSTSSNYRQTSTSTSNSSDPANNSRHREGDIGVLRGDIARNNHHGDFSKASKSSNRHSTSTASSNNSREASDPMSLDSGVITTLSRSVSPMSSTNPGTCKINTPPNSPSQSYLTQTNGCLPPMDYWDSGPTNSPFG